MNDSRHANARDSWWKKRRTNGAQTESMPKEKWGKKGKKEKLDKGNREKEERKE